MFSSIRTRAVRRDGGYVVNGHKIWTSRYNHSHMYLLIARTTPIDAVKKIARTEPGFTLALLQVVQNRRRQAENRSTTNSRGEAAGGSEPPASGKA